MATSQPENKKTTDTQDVTNELEETGVLSTETAPAAATGEASRLAEPAQERGEQTRTEPAPDSIAGPSSAVEWDPAPNLPPIQPVSQLDISIKPLISIPPLTSPPLTLQESDTDTDSAYGDSDHLSDTTSIPSTIWKHRYENGRRYHKFREGEYWGPNDELQNDQLDIAHHMFLLLLDNKLHLAPIENPQRVLDLGCGTGIWCMDMADGASISPGTPSK